MIKRTRSKGFMDYDNGCVYARKLEAGWSVMARDRTGWFNCGTTWTEGETIKVMEQWRIAVDGGKAMVKKPGGL